MKALSVKQPWASLIFHGKNIENRTWKTKFRGTVLIHASAKPVDNFINVQNVLNRKQNEFMFDVNFKLGPLSAIIGAVDIVDCVINHPSIWAEKSNPSIDWTDGSSSFEGKKPIYNWVLENPILFDKPILNVKGGLSFWEYNDVKNLFGKFPMDITDDVKLIDGKLITNNEQI